MMVQWGEAQKIQLMGIYCIENAKAVVELLMKGISDWMMAKKRLLEHFQSKDPKQFVDYKILLDTFYRHPIVVT